MPKDLASGKPSDRLRTIATASSPENVEQRTLVPIRLLQVAASPRVDGEDPEHIRLLLGSAAELPPILVHRQTMRVVDGVHRLRVAQLRGDDEIAVQFFDGTEESAFLEAVRANLAHGLPLSLADRRAAAARVLVQRPEWSDRAIAEAVGLSPDSISLIRRQSGTSRHLTSRVGRDGRARPVDPSQGRIRASELLAARPHASLHEVARSAGIAVGTARDVRDRMRCGMDPVPAKQRAGRNNQRGTAEHEANRKPVDQVALTNLLATLQGLKQDPALKFSDAGRRLLRWFDLHAVSPDDKTWVVTAVPSHCANLIAELARGYATAWHGLAEAIEGQTRPKAM
ncbi:MAG: ParB/RepB/Spo0J family partition protein [Labedaea sp.]